MNRPNEMPKSYDPESLEKEWCKWWDENSSDVLSKINERSDKTKRFAMILPPPNITGKLHIGHALTITLEDALVRWRIMCGDDTIWIPGTDHAGIATQSVVEKHLAKTEKKTRHDLGRQAFVQKVHEWGQQYGTKISSQLKQMGACFNWDKKYFTLDEQRSRAVIQAFIRLHEAGLIYRHNRLVHWSPALNTVISDIEVENVPIEAPTRIAVPNSKYLFVIC